MIYVGSKSRLAKDIIPIINKKLHEYDIKTYIEPFCGGCNIIDKVECKNKIASDNNKYLIALLQNANKIYKMPDIITRDEYNKVYNAYKSRLNKYPDWYIGAVGFLASYNGGFFNGYSGIVNTKIGTVRNYYNENKKNLLKQVQRLYDIQFQCGEYDDLYFGESDCLFYCDIPYKNTKQYAYSKNFDYDRFWNWAEKMSRKNIVLVSEYNAPDSWVCIWQKENIKTMNLKNNTKSVEKLFEIK